MDKVNQLKIKPDMKASELIEQFDKSGVLGSGRVARASNILTDMIKDDEMNIFMSPNRMTFLSSTELPTTQFAPTSAEPLMNAPCLTSVSGPMMQGAPR